MYWLTPVRVENESIILCHPRVKITEEEGELFRKKANKIHARLLSIIIASALAEGSEGKIGPIEGLSLGEQGDIILNHEFPPLSRFGRQFFESLLTPAESLQMYYGAEQEFMPEGNERQWMDTMLEHWKAGRHVVLILE